MDDMSLIEMLKEHIKEESEFSSEYYEGRVSAFEFILSVIEEREK